jgi:hypothetical protein
MAWASCPPPAACSSGGDRQARARASERASAVLPGLDQAALSRHENGHKRPGPRNRALYCDLYGADAAELGFRMALAEEKREHEDVDPISRRSLFGAGVGVTLGPNATTAPTAARELDPELVSHWMRLLRILGCHDAMFGPHDVLDTVRREVGVIAEHRRVARDSLRTQLLSVDDRAVGEGMKALDMARSTKSEMTMRELKRLDHRLAACDAPAAADVHEAFAALHPS